MRGGMRINRAPAEFFKQACRDMMDVIGVRGIGVALNIENGLEDMCKSVVAGK